MHNYRRLGRRGLFCSRPHCSGLWWCGDSHRQEGVQTGFIPMFREQDFRVVAVWNLVRELLQLQLELEGRPDKEEDHGHPHDRKRSVLRVLRVASRATWLTIGEPITTSASGTGFLVWSSKPNLAATSHPLTRQPTATWNWQRETFYRFSPVFFLTSAM